MMKPEPFESTAAADRNPVAVSGIVVSSLGLAGWFVVLAIMLAMPYQATTGDRLRDFFIGWDNLFVFFVRAAVGVVGTSINGTLSIVGIILSGMGLNYEPARGGYIGLGIAVAGLMLGAALVIWRLTVFNVP